jgi:dephospho-CoA kinase
VSRWPGKYVIGLTGNIATGKSLVRKMLEHLGAFGIDADGLTAQAMSKGAPAYQPVIETFGKWILTDAGEINRESLGRVVFSDPEALAKLEAIVHPIVIGAIDTLVKRAKQEVVVIEAIKLLESGLADDCDAIWVADAPEDLQLERLMEKGGLSAMEAAQRMAAQPPQNEKLERATVIVKNTASFEEPWAHVQKEWAAITGTPTVEEVAVKAEVAAEKPPVPAAEAEPVELSLDDLAIERGGPGDAQTIADFINLMRKDGKELTRTDVLMAFGQKAYSLAVSSGAVVGLAGWQVENLITTVDEFYLRTGIPAPQIVARLVEHIEKASAELQSEVALLFVSNEVPGDTLQVFIDAGYEPSKTEDMRVLVWRETAAALQPPDTRLLTKRLREDRVLKPI